MNERFDLALRAFDAANAEDPRLDPVEERPWQLAHAERLSRWIDRLVPGASEALRLAARCQHLKRWTVPRSDYPEGREGYLRWRRDLARFHANEATRVLEAVGYDEATLGRVRRINLKQGIKRDSEVQAMEDALCLVFLEHEAAEFASKHDHDKVMRILEKTVVKMSEQGRSAALELDLPPSLHEALRVACDARDNVRDP